MPKPSELAVSTAPTGSEWIIIVKSGVTYKLPVSRVKQFALGELGIALTSTGNYIGYTDLGWTYTQDLGDHPTDGGASYVYEVSTATGSTFGDNVVQSVTESTFKTSKMFSSLSPFTTYYSRVRAVAGLPGVSNITSQISNPCSLFTATRAVIGANQVRLEIETQLPNTGVFIIEEMAGDMRGLVRPVADDQFNPPNLFIASGEGKARTQSTGSGGKLVFDGGFPKFYNAKWNASYKNDMFSVNTPGQWPYMVNAMKYCSSARSTKTNKILYINDAGSSNYSYSKFISGFAGCAEYLDLTLDALKGDTGVHKPYLTNSDSAATWKTYLMGYDMIVFLGGSHADQYTISDGFLDGLLDYFDEGGGIFVITDHDIFTNQVNQIVSRYGVEFTGDFDRTTGHDAYKVSTILGNSTYLPQGQHPLFVDMDPNAFIHAGGSEGKLIYKTSGTDWGKTSSYVSGADRQLIVTTHNDGSVVGKNKIIVRTANDCGKIFEDISGPPYEYISADGTSLSWTDANAAAIARGGRLAVASSAAKLSELNSYLDTVDYGVGAWIGLRKVSGNWTWVDGTALTTSNWLSGEPNNAFGNEEYVHTLQNPPAGSPDHGWNDSDNSANNSSHFGSPRFGYIIEYT